MERAECPNVCGHCVIIEVAANDLPQPFALHGDGLVHAQSQLLLDHHKLCSHAVGPTLALQHETPLTGSPTDERKAQEFEGFRFAEPSLCASVRCEAAELDQAGLIRMKRQRKPL